VKAPNSLRRFASLRGGLVGALLSAVMSALLTASAASALARDAPANDAPTDPASSRFAAAPAGAAAAAQPEAATGFAPRESVTGHGWMAVTANPHASDAAAQMLRAGGSALDAAIAAQMVLTLVEPQSSGIGGGGFMLHFDAASGRLAAWDGRETAPAAADADLWLRADGQPREFFEAVVGGRSVGVPGLVRMLERAHAQHGRLAWATLIEPAVELARDGFAVSPRLNALLERDRALRKDPQAAALFYDEAGRARPVGYRLRNPALADTLVALARQGSAALHEGPIARDIVATVRTHPTNPGLLTESDLAAYAPRVRDALCIDHGAHRICGMPPPSSGGISVGQLLKIWAAEPARLTMGEAYDVEGAHRFAEAGKLVFADRERYVADIEAPVARALLDDGYLAARAALIGPRALPTPVAAGTPPGLPEALRDTASRAASPERPATTHLSIVDRQGNLVSLTSSIENAFGARLMVRGFLLNNQLTDFSFVADRNGRPVANRPGPGKRPRSAMAPTLVFDRASGAPRLAIGSPGGPQIIHYVARSLIAILDEKLDPQRAIGLPNLGNRNGVTELERGIASSGLADALRARGHTVGWTDMTSGLHAILLDCPAQGWQADGCRLTGAADPRREGAIVTQRPDAAHRPDDRPDGER
jgi:gamma-glutamyltranspeptidase/glutathione hydrolase